MSPIRAILLAVLFASPLFSTEDSFRYDEEIPVEQEEYSEKPTVLDIDELPEMPHLKPADQKRNIIRMGRSKGFFNCAIPIQIFDRRGNMVKVIYRRAFNGSDLKPGRYIASCQDNAEIQFGLLK